MNPSPAPSLLPRSLQISIDRKDSKVLAIRVHLENDLRAIRETAKSDPAGTVELLRRFRDNFGAELLEPVIDECIFGPALQDYPQSSALLHEVLASGLPVLYRFGEHMKPEVRQLLEQDDDLFKAAIDAGADIDGYCPEPLLLYTARRADNAKILRLLQHGVTVDYGFPVPWFEKYGDDTNNRQSRLCRQDYIDGVSSLLAEEFGRFGTTRLLDTLPVEWEIYDRQAHEYTIIHKSDVIDVAYYRGMKTSPDPACCAQRIAQAVREKGRAQM